MLAALQGKGIVASGKAKGLKILCKNNGIRTVILEQKKEEGWEGKPKGMLQILWEQGWIDPQWWQDYTVNGKKDALGRTIDKSSLKFLLGNCNDFINEESMLQYYGRLMGVAVDQTPKCHCELAGEGIKYSCAASKNKYWRFPVGAKKGKEQFQTLVRECLSRQVITTTLVWAFSRTVRQYICAFHALHDQQQTGTDLVTDSKITVLLIEKTCQKNLKLTVLLLILTIDL
jgi:hypothetical protein